MRRRRKEFEPNTISYDGVQYLIVKLGGFGISRGLGSIIEALDGENKGKRYWADLSNGIDRIKSEIIENSD